LVKFHIFEIKKQYFVIRITLFEPEDDLYDGDLIEDDTEFPRVYLRLFTQRFKKNNISIEKKSKNISK